MDKKIISIVSGGFDPIHPGHIMMMKECLEFSNYLIVGVNSNNWLVKKKGNNFMDIKHRIYVIENLSVVNEVMEFDDDDQGSANNLLIKVREKYQTNEIIFANGGDRSDSSKILEDKTANKSNINVKFGVGGNHKESSSSDLLKRWSEYLELKKT